MRWENILQTYDISEKQMQEGVDALAKGLGGLANPSVMIAIADLLSSGDIPLKEDK